tara:strand:+ start:1590 stop:2615 length:1026 start_codon:yes stop_codon:yes gene_type:complete
MKLNNKSILITGGTGSLGNAIIKFIVEKKIRLKRLVIFSRDEVKQSEMSVMYPGDKFKFIRFFIGDIRDFERLDEALNGIDLVIHAAALKQVPSGEYNPMEMIKTNIIGGQNLIRASINNNVKKVIALSTDKAANPINLYGATKLASDKLFIAANNTVGKKKTRFAVVRYGNVANSRGSVIPIFRSLQKSNSSNFPITDIEMTRFWITLEEGVNFIFDSFRRMHGAEIFIPKIPSFRVIDLAKSINSTKKLNIIGIRPGEKLHEIMSSKDDSHNVLEFKDHFIIRPSIKFFNVKNDYFIDALGKKGKKVKKGFEYSSKTNKYFLNIKDLKRILYKLDEKSN